MNRRTAHHRHHRRTAVAVSKHPAHSRSHRYAVASPPQVHTATANHWSLQRRSVTRWFMTFLVFATLIFLAAQAYAQAPAWQSDKIDPALLAKPANSAMEQAHKEGVSKADLSPQWDKFAAFEAYYKKLILGKMRDDAFVGELGTIVQSLLEDVDRANKGKTPAAPLVRGYIIGISNFIAANNYHPAARVNAALLLALVDDASEDSRERKPPVPATGALLPLIKLYMNPEYPDGVRAAALQGTARHASLNAIKDPAYRGGIAKLMMELVNSDPPAGRSPAAHAFMQRYAVEILSVIANPNASAETAKSLVALSTDKNKPNLIAAYAASKISAIQPGKQPLQNLPMVLKTWAGRAADTFDGEIKRIANLDPPIAVRDQPAMPVEDTVPRAGGAMNGEESMMDSMGSAGPSGYDEGMMDSGSGYDDMMMGGMMMPGMMPAAKPQPLEVITSRRRINSVLQQLQLGVTGQPTPGMPAKPAGLLAAATADDKAAFDTWINTISGVVTAINVDTLDDRIKFVEALTAQAIILRELAGGPDAAAAGIAGGPLPLNAPAVAGAGVPVPAPVGPPGMVSAPAAPAPAVAAPLAPGAAPAAAAPAAAAPAAAAPVVDELE